MEFLIKENIKLEDLEDYQLKYFLHFLENIKEVRIDDNSISFETRYINNDENIEYIIKHYERLRQVFGIKPYARLPDKKVSSLIVKISKLFTDVIIKNTRVYCLINDKPNTSGFYSIDLKPRSLDLTSSYYN